MHTVQAEVENKYSRKSIGNMVLQDMGTDNDIFNKMVQLIDNYRKGNYFSSKQDRISKLTMASSIIAEYILINTLVAKEINPIQSIATQIGQKLGYTLILDAVKTGAELLAVTEPAGLFTIYHSTNRQNDTGTLGIRSNYLLEADTEAFINQTKYLPPMISKPVSWFTNNTGGYIQGSGSVILGHLNHHVGHQALDVINILQSIEWSLNEMMDYIEKPKHDLDTPIKAKQFNTMADESNVVYNELLAHGNKFYFVWKYDKRGRMYSQGYHCNLQSTEYKKSILNFSKEELII